MNDTTSIISAREAALSQAITSFGYQVGTEGDAATVCRIAETFKNYITSGTIPPVVSEPPSQSLPQSPEGDRSGLLERPQPSQEGQEGVRSVRQSYSAPVSGLDTETVAEPAGGVNALAGEG